MSLEYYKEAVKQGQKEYKKSISQGKSPYLPVLDEILQTEETDRGIDIGIVQVPAHLIVGTKTAGRTKSFANNFMPLLPENTEFAIKWRNLCSAHLEEGIRDPITVYEYLNRYYVEEGNKRCSVLKFFEAVTIPARVTRILPINKEDPEKAAYFELLDFIKLTGINFIEFSLKDRYFSLLQAMGKTKDEVWNEGDRQLFKSNFYIFLRAYHSLDAKYQKASSSDAFLAYIKVFGYYSFSEIDDATLKKNIKKMSEEISLMTEDSPIEINVNPEEHKAGIIKQVINAAMFSGKKLEIAFIHDKNKENSGWTNNHELGRIHVQSYFEDKINTTPYYDAMEDPVGVLNQAIADGNTVIFTTSPKLLQASLLVAVEHPEVVIYNCSLNKPHRFIRSYNARIYEAKFIAGAIAASLNHGNDLGYVCNYPIYGHIAGINAFALGAQLVNPDAKVYLEWSCIKGVHDAVNSLLDKNINLISSLEFVSLKEEDYSFYGLFQMKDGKKTSLAVPLYQWDTYYEEIIRRILNGSIDDYDKSHKALSYYWGISAGVVDILCSASMPVSTKKLTYFLRESIGRANCRPFMGKIIKQDGSVIETPGQQMSLEEIINMDYLVENVVGDIPSYEELKEEAKSTVDVVGIDKIIQEL